MEIVQSLSYYFLKFMPTKRTCYFVRKPSYNTIFTESMFTIAIKMFNENIYLKLMPTNWACVVASKPSFDTNLTKSVMTIAVETHHISTDINLFHTYRTLITNMWFVSLKLFKLLNSLKSQASLLFINWVMKVYFR